MRLTVKGQRADTEVNGSLLPTYGMQTSRKTAKKKIRTSIPMPFLPTSYGFGAIGNRTEWRDARPHPEQIPLPEPSSVTRPVCDRPENSCGIPIIDIRSIHSSPYKAYFAKKQSVHPVFISYIYK